MKIDFDAPIYGPDGVTPLALRPARPEEPVPPATRLGDVVSNLVITEHPGDAQTPGLKQRLYYLHWLVRRGGQQELEATDIQVLEQRAQASLSVFVYGQVVDLLHSRAEPLDKPLEVVPPLPPPPPMDPPA